MSQNHKNGLQKRSQKRAPKKHQKNDDFQHPHTPLDRALAAARARFSLFDQMCLWHPFGSHFGGVLGAQMEAKAIKKPHQKNIKKMMPKMTPNWSQHEAKIVKSEVLEAPCFKDGSQVASRPPPGSILERFWNHFGTIFVSFSKICLMIFACIL